MGKEVEFPNRAMNQTSDGYEIMPYPSLNGDEANVTSGDTKAEIAVTAGAKAMFVTPTTTDCVIKGGVSPITIGANEGYIIPKNTTIPFKIEDGVTHVAYQRSGDADGKISYTFE